MEKSSEKKGYGRLDFRSKMKTFRQKIFKIEDNPEKIARGFALGTFIGMTPFVGLQFFISVFIAGLLKWNKIAAGIAVFQTNVFTGAFVFSFNYFLGAAILGVEYSFSLTNSAEIFSLSTIFCSGPSAFCSFLLGGLITGIPSSLLAYIIVRHLMLRKQTNSDQTLISKSQTMKTNVKTYALVTGASRGLGRALALELASRKQNLLLVSLGGEKLGDLCHQIQSQYLVDADFLEINLADPKAASEVVNWIGSREIQILINNAGIGGVRRFETAESAYLNAMIDVNIRSLSLLTWYLLPKLKSCDLAFILNVASMASFSPIAYKTIYPASKAFVYNFSLCLNEELKETGVSVSVLNPGPMVTNPDVAMRINQQSKLARFGLMTPEEVARIAIRNLFKSKPVIVPGFGNQVFRFLMKVVPSKIRIPLISANVKRELSCSQSKRLLTPV